MPRAKTRAKSKARPRFKEVKTTTKLLEFMRERPETQNMSRAEIVALAHKNGLRTVTLGLVTYVRGKITRDPSLAGNDGEAADLSKILAVKKLADTVGGMQRLRQYISLLEKVRA